jgi:hypothetical protein
VLDRLFSQREGRHSHLGRRDLAHHADASEAELDLVRSLTASAAARFGY